MTDYQAITNAAADDALIRQVLRQSESIHFYP